MPQTIDDTGLPGSPEHAASRRAGRSISGLPGRIAIRQKPSVHALAAPAPTGRGRGRRPRRRRASRECRRLARRRGRWRLRAPRACRRRCRGRSRSPPSAATIGGEREGVGGDDLVGPRVSPGSTSSSPVARMATAACGAPAGCGWSMAAASARSPRRRGAAGAAAARRRLRSRGPARRMWLPGRAAVADRDGVALARRVLLDHEASAPPASARR